MLVARHGDVSRKLNLAFLLVDSSNFYFVDEQRSYIYYYYYYGTLLSPRFISSITAAVGC